MSERFDVVVFHVLDDGEMVADRAHVRVQQCSDNQVWYDSLRAMSEQVGQCS